VPRLLSPSGAPSGVTASFWSRRGTRQALLAGLLAVAAIWVFSQKAAARMPDFEVDWRAGQRAAHAEPLYRASDADYQFKYFPAFAVAAIPLGALSLPVAEAV
jgi:hypothetical protein